MSIQISNRFYLKINIISIFSINGKLFLSIFLIDAKKIKKSNKIRHPEEIRKIFKFNETIRYKFMTMRFHLQRVNYFLNLKLFYIT